MKRILLINLRRLGDIYSMANLVPALQKKHNAKIDLLVYKESLNATLNLSDINQIYSIDRKSIITKKQNPVFQDGMALNEFNKAISRLKQNEWDIIINISNDTVGSYITSILTNLHNKTQHEGIKFSSSNTVMPSNLWAIVLNDILPCFKYSPFHFLECYSHLLQLDNRDQKPLLKTDSHFEKLATENLRAIRENETLANTNLKLVGLQLKTSTKEKNIPFDTLIELINKMLDTPDLYPILLVSPSEQEKNYARQLNSYFDNRLVIVESDLCALKSVLAQIDLLITPDTVTKHIADICNTPLLEISLGPSPFLKQGTINSNSLILSNALKSRTWNTLERNSVTAEDIFNVTKAFFYPNFFKHLVLSRNVTLFKPIITNNHICYRTIAGEVSHKEEIARQFARSYIFSIIKAKPFDYPHVPLSCYQTTKTWIQGEKLFIAEASRKLLRTLRELIRIKDTNTHDKASFIGALDQLLLGCDDSSIAAISLLFFRAKLESLPKSSFKISAPKIEALLYLLKEDLQHLSQYLKQFDISLIRKSTNKTLIQEAP